MVPQRPPTLPTSFPIRIALLLLVGAFLVTSCSLMKGTSSQEDGGGEPDWFLDNRPMDPHHIFAAATATGSRLQMASSKAATRARGNIAEAVETRFQGLTKQFQEEVGAGPNAESVSQFTQAYKSVVNQTINGAEVVEREIVREDGRYRAYILMRMPIGDAQENLLQQIQANRNAFARFQSSQAYQQLEREVEGHRQREREQEDRRQGRTSQRDTQTPPSDTQSAPQDQTQTEQNETLSGPEGTVREVQGGETRQPTEKPTEEQIRAPEPEAELQEGDAPMTEAQQIESRLRVAAEPWMGTPYQFGGESRDGVDCSALTQALFKEAFNIDLPRTTGKQVNRGSAVDRSEMRPGDLVFFRTSDQQKHVGIYVNDQRFVHASSSQGVTISPLTYDYWQEHYWTTRRLSVL